MKSFRPILCLLVSLGCGAVTRAAGTDTLTLSALREQVLRAHPRITVAALRSLAAGQTVVAARSGFFPFISANATGDPSASFKNTVWPWSSPSPNPSCMRAKRFARMRMGLPDRMRTVSGPLTASAGMPSSAVERGLKYPKAAGLCIKGVRVSRLTADFSSHPPSRVRRRAVTCPKVPRAWAISRTQDRT